MFNVGASALSSRIYRFLIFMRYSSSHQTHSLLRHTHYYALQWYYVFGVLTVYESVDGMELLAVSNSLPVSDAE